MECESLDRAVEVAARVPEADLGLVEVRPVLDLDLGGLEVWARRLLDSVI